MGLGYCSHCQAVVHEGVGLLNLKFGIWKSGRGRHGVPEERALRKGVGVPGALPGRPRRAEAADPGAAVGGRLRDALRPQLGA